MTIEEFLDSHTPGNSISDDANAETIRQVVNELHFNFEDGIVNTILRMEYTPKTMEYIWDL